MSAGLLQYCQCCIKTNQSACSEIQKKPITPFPICVIMLWFWLCTDWRGCSQVCCVMRVNESRVKGEWITVRAVGSQNVCQWIHFECPTKRNLKDLDWSDLIKWWKHEQLQVDLHLFWRWLSQNVLILSVTEAQNQWLLPQDSRLARRLNSGPAQ